MDRMVNYLIALCVQIKITLNFFHFACSGWKVLLGLLVVFVVTIFRQSAEGEFEFTFKLSRVGYRTLVL